MHQKYVYKARQLSFFFSSGGAASDIAHLQLLSKVINCWCHVQHNNHWPDFFINLGTVVHFFCVWLPTSPCLADLLTSHCNYRTAHGLMTCFLPWYLTRLSSQVLTQDSSHCEELTLTYGLMWGRFLNTVLTALPCLGFNLFSPLA